MKKILSVALTIAAMYTISCGGAALLNAPAITGIVMNEASITITWNTDTVIENHVDFNGYNIYVSTDSTELLVENAEDLDKINAIAITGNTYTTPATLSQDSIYYIQVRTVNIDNEVGWYNANVPFVIASPRPEFTATVSFEMNSPGVDDSCAIRFSDATIMADSAMPNGDADMWVTLPYDTPARDDCDLLSPHLHAEYGTNSRITNFVNLGQYQFDDISEVTTEPTENSVFTIVEGDLVIAKTEDSNYIKIHVDAINGFSTVTITYAYQNIADFPYF